MSEPLLFIIALIVSNLFWMVFTIMLLNSSRSPQNQVRMPKIAFPGVTEILGKKEVPPERQVLEDVTTTDTSISDILESVQKEQQVNG